MLTKINKLGSKLLKTHSLLAVGEMLEKLYTLPRFAYTLTIRFGELLESRRYAENDFRFKAQTSSHR